MVRREPVLSKVSVLVALALCCTGNADVPRSLADFLSRRPVDSLPGLPGMAVVSSVDVDRWIDLLQLAPEQAAEVRAGFDQWIANTHNPYVDAALPRYLDLAGKAAALLNAEGDPSENHTTAFATASVEVERVMVAMDVLERAFIDSFQKYAPPTRDDLLWRIRSESTRRAAVNTIGTQSRWIRFDVWAIWDGVCQRVAPEARETARAALIQHDRECVRLTMDWARARLEGGRQVQRWLLDDARGQPARDPAKLWERSAALEAALRDLHVATVEVIVDGLDKSIGSDAWSLYVACTFPEVIDGPELPQARDTLDALIDRCGADLDCLARALAIRDTFERDYAAATTAMRDACARWDEAVASGVGNARPQGLSVALSAQRDARRALCDEVVSKFSDR